MPHSIHSFEKHIDIIDAGQTAVDIIATNTSLSKQKIKQIMLKGAVWLTHGKKTQRIRRAKKTLPVGDCLHIYYDESVLNKTPNEPTLISDEERYSVWNKPYGLLSQGSKWGDHCTLTRYAEQHLTPRRPSFLVHRLDRAANGLMLIAHDKKAVALFSKAFQERQIRKKYRIWVHGEFPSTATYDQLLTESSDIDDRHAVSHFTRLSFDQCSNRSLLDVNIDTGRKHQIRIHAARLGYPIVGDRLHGTEADKEDLQLKAYYLSFTCPFSKKLKAYNL